MAMAFINWELIKEAALHQFGKPYQFGYKPDYQNDKDPKAFDCSAFVKWCYQQGGVIVPDGSQQQFDASVPITYPQFGDVGFFRKPNEPTHHVGMLLNKLEVIEARGFEPTLEAQGIRTNCVLIRPRVNWEAFSEFTGWKRFKEVMQ